MDLHATGKKRISMRILHAGLGASTEKNADLFFQELLGLTKAGPVALAAEFCAKVFGIEREMQLINYKAEGIHCEVIIDSSYRAADPTVVHTCLEVEDQAEFLNRCVEKGLKISRIPKGNSFVVFIADLDGNPYEIKAKV
jgi:catechol 2,3-dioxygenase-like lactoylglutathione lyase family enzyme